MSRSFGRISRRSLIAGIGVSAIAQSLAFAEDPTPTPDGASELAPNSSNLPAADLPTMNAQGLTFQVSSTFSGNFSSVPTSAAVYNMQFTKPTKESVQQRAKALNLDGDVQDLGGDTFSLKTDAGAIYATPGRLQYVSSEKVEDGDLPSDQSAISSAREWLRSNNLLPANIGDGRILERIDEAGRVLIGFTPSKPAPLLSASPMITVTVGRRGKVLEFTDGWADITAGETYQLRGAESAWEEVESRRAWLDANLPSDKFKPNATVGGSVEFNALSIAYTTSGVPGEKQYLQPVYVFDGLLKADGVEGSWEVRSFVPALINSNQPVG